MTINPSLAFVTEAGVWNRGDAAVAARLSDTGWSLASWPRQVGRALVCREGSLVSQTSDCIAIPCNSWFDDICKMPLVGKVRYALHPFAISAPQFL